MARRIESLMPYLLTADRLSADTHVVCACTCAMHVRVHAIAAGLQGYDDLTNSPLPLKSSDVVTADGQPVAKNMDTPWGPLRESTASQMPTASCRADGEGGFNQSYATGSVSRIADRIRNDSRAATGYCQ